MYLTKRQSIIIACGVLSTFFGVVFAIMRLNSPPPPAAKEAPVSRPIAGESFGHAQFALDNFHRSEIKDGRKSWEIFAGRGEFYPDKQALILTKPDLWLYRPNGEKVKLTSLHATVYMSGAALTAADLEGEVTAVYNDETTAVTERARYDRTQNLLHAPGAVRISGEKFEITGEDLTVNTETKIAVLKKNVHTVIVRGLNGIPALR